MSPTSIADPRTVDAADGRRRRGEASRRALLDAATSVIAADGMAALTYRAVAEAAQVPLARVAYHFPTVDDLALAAAERYLAAFDERLRTAVDAAVTGRRSVVEACTDVLVELTGAGGDEFLAMVEVRIALHRRGRTVDGSGVVGAVASFGADDEQAAGVVASLFGFAVLAATEPTPPPRAAVRRYVAGVLGVAS